MPNNQRTRLQPQTQNQPLLKSPVFLSRSFTYDGSVKSLYSFKESFFLENNMKSYSFEHERLYKLDQESVIDYELCCFVFIKSHKNDEYIEYTKLCGNDENLQCIISNNRLLITVDMSFLEEGSDIEIVLSCMFDWLSLPAQQKEEQQQRKKVRVEFNTNDFFDAG